MPFPIKVAPKSPYKPSIGPSKSIESSEISVNAPQIDRLVEFSLASTEDPLYPIPRTSSTSARCSTSSPTTGDRSITKDKCTVQILGTTSSQPRGDDRARRSGSECSEKNLSTVVSSRSSSDSRRHRFDTSSYEQRAQALEGLLEFSAQLLKQERFDELGVLLKPFGPGKVSPRETAIWLTKSFKETSA